jgi:hypothetical protein
VELFGPKRIQQFTIDLVPANPAFSGYSITVPITRPGGAFIAPESGLTLRAPGEWTMTVRGTTTTGDLEPLTATFIIADGTTVTTLPASETTTPSAPTDTGQPTAPAETTTTTSAPPG